MTIWAFGDSYVDSYKNNSKYNQLGSRGIKPWIESVGLRLNQQVNNLGCCGSSVDFSYTKFNKVRHQICENDIIIFGLTSLDRRWFLPNNPTKSVITTNTILNFYTSEQREAIKNYLLYLDREDIQHVYLKNFIENLYDLTNKLKLHTILIPCMYIEYEILKEHKHLYPNLQIPNGFLSNVNYKQYSEKFHAKMMRTFVEDGLINHLVWSNHSVLTEKIIKNIVDKEPIDLENGFYEYIVTGKTITDEKFLKREFSTNPNY